MLTPKYKLLVVADSVIPVPPSGYGGTERIVGYLMEGLASRGYSITLIGAEGSRPPGRLVSFCDATGSPRLLRGTAKTSFWRLLKREIGRHDLVHSVGRLDYLLPVLRSPVPKILNFQSHINREQVDYVRRHSQGRIVLTACGVSMLESVRDGGAWRPIHNAVPVSNYTYRTQPESPRYLAYLGRITPCKGAAIAIRVARRAGLRLVIAGNIGIGPWDRPYFDNAVRPHIDGQNVRYVGEVDDAAKDEILGGAVALVNPIRWDEPFGLTTIETLACGTPVVAFGKGELPNILRNGVTGFLCSNEDEMVTCMKRVGRLNRKVCRQEAETRFDVSRMVSQFEDTYRWALSTQPAIPQQWSRP